METQQLYTLDQAVKLTGVPAKKINQLARSGALNPLRGPGGRIFLTVQDIGYFAKVASQTKAVTKEAFTKEAEKAPKANEAKSPAGEWLLLSHPDITATGRTRSTIIRAIKAGTVKHKMHADKTGGGHPRYLVRLSDVKKLRVQPYVRKGAFTDKMKQARRAATAAKTPTLTLNHTLGRPEGLVSCREFQDQHGLTSGVAFAWADQNRPGGPRIQPVPGYSNPRLFKLAEFEAILAADAARANTEQLELSLDVKPAGTSNVTVTFKLPENVSFTLPAGAAADLLKEKLAGPLTRDSVSSLRTLAGLSERDLNVKLLLESVATLLESDWTASVVTA